MTSADQAPLESSRFTGAARGFVIFVYGLFSISAQTLIFREFLTSFESNDITIGIFFGCWFLWIALGAMLVNRSSRLAEVLTANIELLLLAYLPALVMQGLLIIHIRHLAGIAPYTLLPIPTALFLGAIVNAPVSLITGLLFPLTCRWVRLDTTPAVSRVYLLESFGSFIGGLGTTVLLAFGATSIKIFLLLAFILTLAVLFSFVSVSRRKGTIPAGGLMIVLGFALIFGADKPLSDYLRGEKWNQLLPGNYFAGSFQTAQAEYLCGRYQGQWVAVREGSVVEALPDPTSAGNIIALTLAQNPAATRVLIVGNSFGLCRQFLQLPQIKRLVWSHPDAEFVKRILKSVPPELSISDSRFEGFAGDIRSLLGRQNEKFDLVIVNMPAATSSVSNRYYTLDFFRDVKHSLGPAGVIAVCVPGGENIMGTELVTIGASTKLTLAQVFSNMVLAPGDTTWFIASDVNNITGNPNVLRQRFASIAHADEVYPANGLMSIYLPDRAAKALGAYNAAELPAEHLINRDSRPLANLFGLLLSAKQSDAPVTRLFKHLLMGGFPVLLAPIIIFVVLRLIFVLSAPTGLGQSTFDCAFLVFCAGLVGIGVVIVLMFLYQTRFGSLYLYIGAISSLYMAGLAAGAAIANHLLKKFGRYFEQLLSIVLLIQCATLAGIAFLPDENWSHLIFAVTFVVCGVCAGCYFPLAGRLLADKKIQTTQTAARLETADHFGAAAGGVITSLVLIPVLGAKLTLVLFILFVLANLPASGLRIYCPTKISTSPALRSAGYALFGVAATLIVCSNLLVFAGRQITAVLPPQAAQALAGAMRIEPAIATIPNSGKAANYFKTYDANNKLTGYIFSSDDLAPNVRGFGGKMNIAVLADVNGRLIDFHIIRSNETPVYLYMLNNWFGSLNGRDIFREHPFAGVDAVTGATVSSKAVLQAIAQSGAVFASGVLKQTSQQKTTSAAGWMPDLQGAYLLVAVLLTVIVIYRGGFWSRLFVLAVNIVIAGFYFNAQFSTEQVASLLSIVLPFAAPTGVFILTIGAPLLAILLGNIYCGYLCPFGALQEIIGFVIPARFRPVLSREQMQKARFVKFVVLFVLITAFVLSRNHDALAVDPLIKVFSLRHFNELLLLIVAVALVGSPFYSRFWCRYLCPAGAFLSLFNKLAIFSRYLPTKRYSDCKYGLSYNDKLDCIFCDKCRFDKKPVAEPVVGFGSRYLLPAVVVIAIGLAAVSVNSLVYELPASAAVAATVSGGQPRNADEQKIKKMIRENKLSDREADFYKKAE